MNLTLWNRQVMQFVEEETYDQDGWETEWPQRLRLAMDRAELEVTEEAAHPDQRLSALAYVAAWCVIGARVEEKRRKTDFNRRPLGFTKRKWTG